MSALSLLPSGGAAAGWICILLAVSAPCAAQSADPPAAAPAAASSPAAGPASAPASAPESAPGAAPEAVPGPGAEAPPAEGEAVPSPLPDVPPFDLQTFAPLEPVGLLEPLPPLPGEARGPGLLLRAPAEWERRALAERSKLPAGGGLKLPRSLQLQLQLRPTEAVASLSPVPLGPGAARPELRFRAAWTPTREFSFDLVPGVYLDRNGAGAATTGATMAASVATAWADGFRTTAEVESPRLGGGSARLKLGAAWQPWERVSIDTRFEQRVGANVSPDPTVRLGFTFWH